MYPVSGPQSPHVERSSALLPAGFDRLAHDGVLTTGITPELATSALRAALRGVAHTVAATPDSPDNDLISATVRDAIITSLITEQRKERDSND
jgi:hypothetical protein